MSASVGFTVEGEVSTGGGVLVVLYHEDLKAAEARVRAPGCEISRGIFAFPGGHGFHFVDPGGNELAVWS